MGEFPVDPEDPLAPARDQSLEGLLALREVRSGRAEVVPMWGRPESFRREFRRLRAQ